MRTTLALLICLAFSAPCGFASERPNVLLIITDDQGYGDFSAHGNPYLKTPNVDALSEESVRFDRYFVNSFCSPTRAALLTGRYPLRGGVWGVTHNKENFRDEEVTIAEAFSAAGYRTACIGKWHNGEQYPYTPQGQGFQESFGFRSGHFNNYFDPVLLRQSEPEQAQGYITDVLTDEAIAFLERNQSEPFFCYLAYNAPHSPYQVPDRFFDKYAALGLDETLAAFYAMCESIDENIGRLLEAMERLKLDENTIVLFMTDNGGTIGVPTYNAGMRGGKMSVHEGGSRVPLFIRWPGKIGEPRTIETLAAHIDLYPTLAELCHVPRPEGPALDGVSLASLLTGQTDSLPERLLFIHNPQDGTNRYPGAVRSPQYRLVREPARGARPDDSGWELYDMQQDPGEQNDLASSKPEVVAELSEQYERWFDEVSQTPIVRFPIPVGYSEENPVSLHAHQAYFSKGVKFHFGPGFAHSWLSKWTEPGQKVWFEIDVVESGDYEVDLIYAAPEGGSQMQLAIGEETRTVVPPAEDAPEIPLQNRASDWNPLFIDREWGVYSLGTLPLMKGPQTISLEAQSVTGDTSIDFKGFTLRRIED